MNLEDKADSYIKPFKHQLALGGEQSVKDDFKAGYKQAIKDVAEGVMSGVTYEKSKYLHEYLQLLMQ